ncbi:class II glutamine amidotransferase [candidate division KSB1 bacterium]|nr:class II glutamine amidotransferase [candidate division KSB1 bacterium]
MLIAVGKPPMDVLLDDFAIMASNRNEKHENNEKREFQHADGWGIVYTDNEILQVDKYTQPCYNDPNLSNYRDLESPIVILHARKGSKGHGGVELVNTHPFWYGNYIFCHNGTVDQKLTFDNAFSPKGKTDSEQLFYYMLTNMNGSFNESYISDKLNAIHDFTGMNSIFSDGHTSFIINWYRLRPLYYALKFMETSDYFVLSSEILPHLKSQNWQQLKNHDILRLETESRSFRIYNGNGNPQ